MNKAKFSKVQQKIPFQNVFKALYERFAAPKFNHRAHLAFKVDYT